MEEKENKGKVAYDGRLEYYKHLRDYWDGLKNASINSDINMWLKYLRGYYSRTMGFISSNEKTKLSNLFNEVSSKLNRLQAGMNTFFKNDILEELLVHNKLQEIEDMLFFATKNMLVPFTNDDDDDFDEDNFFKESDL